MTTTTTQNLLRKLDDAQRFPSNYTLGQLAALLERAATLIRELDR